MSVSRLEAEMDSDEFEMWPVYFGVRNKKQDEAIQRARGEAEYR